MRPKRWTRAVCVAVSCGMLHARCVSNADRVEGTRSQPAAPASNGGDKTGEVEKLTLSVVSREDLPPDVAVLLRNGWELLALWAPKLGTSTHLQVSVVDARHDDAVLLGYPVRIGDAPTTIVVATRVHVLGETAPHVGAEILIGSSRDKSFHELARASPPPDAIPSLKAAYGDDLDSELPKDEITVRSDMARTFARISWNGFFSARWAGIVHRDPDLPGTFSNYTVFSPGVEDPRIHGPIESWPEPVWLVRARLSDRD